MLKIRLAAMVLLVCLGLGASALAAGTGTATVCVSMEKFALGQGYLIEPVLVEVPEDAQASAVLTQLLQQCWPDQDTPWKQTGTISEAFYLSAVYDPNRATPSVPAYISKLAAINDVDTSPDWLGEFDYCSTSGWMYSVNDAFPNVGASDYFLKQGDVMRWQFTLYGYGSDLGADNSEWGAEDITAVGNKDALTWEVALLNGAYSRTLREQNEAYREALETLQNLEAEQAAIDDTLRTLRADGPRFADVPAGAWYGEAVDQAVKSNLFCGTSETQFSPDMALSRSMALEVLYRMAGKPAATSGNYTDVSKADWFHSSAAWAYRQGLMEDFAGAQMLPTKAITRIELATVLYRWLGDKAETDIDVLAEFADYEEIPAAMQSAMAWAVDMGIFQGDGENRLLGASELTRCQFATIAGRIPALVI